MRIGLISEVDSTRPAAWSGTIYFMAEALAEAGAEMRRLGPLWRRRSRLLTRLGHAARRVGLADPMLNRTGAVARLKSRALDAMVGRAEIDALFAPVGSTLIARYGGATPLIYSSDATVLGMVDYYPEFTGLPRALLDRIVAEEREAMRRSSLLLYPTWWAARDAVDSYGIDPARVLVQPFGANLLGTPSRATALAPRRAGALAAAALRRRLGAQGRRRRRGRARGAARERRGGGADGDGRGAAH